MTAWSSGSLNTLGLGLPSWARGVTLPTCVFWHQLTHRQELFASINPKPMLARPVTASAPLSKPAATPTGLGKVRFHSFTYTGAWLMYVIKEALYITCRAGSSGCLHTGWIPLLKLHTASLCPVSPLVNLITKKIRKLFHYFDFEPSYNWHKSCKGRLVSLVEQDAPANSSSKDSQASELPVMNFLRAFLNIKSGTRSAAT